MHVAPRIFSGGTSGGMRGRTRGATWGGPQVVYKLSLSIMFVFDILKDF